MDNKKDLLEVKIISQSKRKTPQSFKIGREFELRRSEAERTLFDSLGVESKERTIKLTETADKNVSLLTIKRINFALGKILYNQSYQTKNTEENTGVAKGGTLSDGSPIEPLRYGDKIYHHGEIIVKLSDLAAAALGVDPKDVTNAKKKEIEGTLYAMQKGLIVTYTDGVVLNESLLWIKRTLEDPKTKAKILDIVLNPIYAIGVANNFGAHPQDVLKRIGRATEPKLSLLSLLGIQDKRKPFRRYITTLLQDIGLYDEYKKKGAKYILKKLNSIFASMVKCGIISDLPEQRTGSTGEEEFIFYLSEDYVPKEPKQRKPKESTSTATNEEE